MEVIIALSAVIIILLIVLIVKSTKKSDDTKFKVLEEKVENLNKNVSDSLISFRNENMHSLEKVSEKLSEMTKQNYEQQLSVIKSLNENLNTMRETNLKDAERHTVKLDNAIKTMQESNEKKLDEMRKTVDEKLNETLTTRLNSSFKTVSQQLENVYKSLGEMKELSSGVTTNVQSLNRVLTNVKARGTWAEVQLENILEQTIPGMFDKNVQTDPKSLARVEFAVRIPSNDGNGSISYLPIDSKFPMEDYIRLTAAADCADADGVEVARKALERKIKDEAKSINQYINHSYTTPFAIMYLATEGLYAEVTSSKTGLAEKIQTDYSVLIAGPTTITALLNSLAMGFRTLAINQKAGEIWKLLGIAKGQYDKFGSLLQKAKQKVDEASRTLDAAQNRNDIIQKKLRSVETLDENLSAGEIDDGNLDETLEQTNDE